MKNLYLVVLIVFLFGSFSDLHSAQPLKPVNQRFSAASHEEVPDFQRHVVPLMSRLGCNGRACHGSFQGRGGFQLSLFGYDFAVDHQALFDEESPRVIWSCPMKV